MVWDVERAQNSADAARLDPLRHIGRETTLPVIPTGRGQNGFTTITMFRLKLVRLRTAIMAASDNGLSLSKVATSLSSMVWLSRPNTA